MNISNYLRATHVSTAMQVIFSAPEEHVETQCVWYLVSMSRQKNDDKERKDSEL